MTDNHPRFCQRCGTPLQPGQRYCTGCGTPVGDPTQQHQYGNYGFPPPPPPPPVKKKKMKWWVVVLIVVFLFVVLFRLTLDLLDEKERRGGSFFPHKLESEQTYGEEIYREGAATDEPLAAPAEQVYAVETDSIAAADYRRAE